MNAADQFESWKHTPGPWEAVNSLVRSSMVQPEGTGRLGGVMVAECADGFGLKFGSEACANARLIAAAPDLLEALQLILENDGSEGARRFDAMTLSAARVKALTAIGKVAGGTS